MQHIERRQHREGIHPRGQSDLHDRQGSHSRRRSLL